ncbi:MAG: MotA/TolQ/ExbB proton channel family protein [Myxococcales bacterium]
MHVAIGMLGFAAVLAATVLLEQREAAFSGLFYRPALLLLCAGPLFISLVSHKVEELFICVRTVWKAMRFSATRSRAILHDELSRFAAEVRRGRPGEALAIAEGAQHDLVRQLAPLVVKQYAAEDIERTANTASSVLASSMKRSEDVLTSLARVAPAVGLVGTTLGLITLLKDLRNFDHLGPSMALALLCTLYGLVLANGIYQPLARLVHVHAVATLEEARLLSRALLLVGEGKPLADVRALFGVEPSDAAARAEVALG